MCAEGAEERETVLEALELLLDLTSDAADEPELACRLFVATTCGAAEEALRLVSRGPDAFDDELTRYGKRRAVWDRREYLAYVGYYLTSEQWRFVGGALAHWPVLVRPLSLWDRFCRLVWA
jgi:sirohydrochlorin ferrochelatase